MSDNGNSDEDQLYTVSKSLNDKSETQELPLKKKQKRVENDFFAFHFDEEEPKKKKKKKKRVKRDPDADADTLNDDSGVEVVRVLRKLERLPSKQRDVTPPPVELESDEHSGSSPTVDELILNISRASQNDEDDTFELNLNYSTVLLSSAANTYKHRPKRGLEDNFKLKVDLSMLGINSTLEILVKGAARVEKVLKKVCEYLQLSGPASQDIIMVYDSIKLLNATQICNILTIDENLEKDVDNRYLASLLVMKEHQYKSWKQEQQLRLEAKIYENDEDIHVLETLEEEDDKKFNMLNIHELEKLASQSLRSKTGSQELDVGSFKITLKASEKEQLEISVYPEMRIREIHKLAIEYFAISRCKLVFDDEDMDLDDFVKNTELEDEFIIEVVTVE